MPRIALKIEYLGTRYHGWQRQPELVSIQGTIEKALFQFLQEEVGLVAAGRTDKGVHATGQIAHFDTSKNRPLYTYIFGLNHFLPNDIRVIDAFEVAPDFHARFSAIFRRYEMHIFNRSVDSATLSERMLWHPVPLDVALMQQGADYLIGEHDFTSFRGADCQAHSPIKTLNFCKISRHNEKIIINIQASGFLHKMVRNITGVLIKIGEGRRTPNWALSVLNAKERAKGGKTVSPHGLYLVEIGYKKG